MEVSTVTSYNGTWGGGGGKFRVPMGNFPMHIRKSWTKQKGAGYTSTLYTPHLLNANLLKYIDNWTFSPNDEAVASYMASVLKTSTAIQDKVSARQAEVHRNMLEQGAMAVCQGSISVNDAVRIPEFDPGTGAAVPEIDGSIKWDARQRKVVEIVRANKQSRYMAASTPVDAVRYKVKDVKRLLYRYEVCPVDSVSIGRIVRVKLDRNSDVGKERDGSIKTREAKYKFFHVWTRSLFVVVGATVVYDDRVHGVDRADEYTESPVKLNSLRMEKGVERVKYHVKIVWGAFWQKTSDQTKTKPAPQHELDPDWKPGGTKYRIPTFPYCGHEAKLANREAQNKDKTSYDASFLQMCDVWIQKMFIGGTVSPIPNGRSEMFAYTGEPGVEFSWTDLLVADGWRKYGETMQRAATIPTRRTYQIRGVKGYTAMAAVIRSGRDRGDALEGDFLQFMQFTDMREDPPVDDPMQI